MLGACDGPPAPHCQLPFIGDRTQPVEVQLLITDGSSEQLAPLHDGDTVPLEPPPQGGYVVYLGAAARNLDPCNAVLAGTLRDPVNGDQLGFDARNTNLVLGGDGWGKSDPTNNANVSNVNVCPDYSPMDRQGQSFILEMKVTDRGGRSGVASAHVTPVCNLANPTTQADCICTCSANYCLGKCDPRSDGGACR